MSSRKQNLYLSVLVAFLLAFGGKTVRAAQPTRPSMQSTEQTQTDSTTTTKKKKEDRGRRGCHGLRSPGRLQQHQEEIKEGRRRGRASDRRLRRGRQQCYHKEEDV